MSADATRCKVCGGQFSAKRVIIDGMAYHERCAVMSYPSHTHEDYSRLSDQFSVAAGALEKIAAMDPFGVRADDLGRAARIARDAMNGGVGSPTIPSAPDALTPARRPRE